MRKDRPLTHATFSQFLQRLDADPERAARRYVVLRRQLVFWFERHACYRAEELADQALDIAVERCANGVEMLTQDVAAYVYGVAKKLLLADRSRPQQTSVPLDELPAHSEARHARDAEQKTMEKEDAERRAACLRHCLNQLSAAERRMLRLYYHDNWHLQVRQRKVLAAKLGLSEVGLRTRMHRLRELLADCTRRCLQKGKR
jgi:RNA polymerase sigma factor (sigma-70 family)